MLQQYFRIRSEHPGVLVAIRVGDFFEFYGEDAEIAARDLEITLTGRDDGGERIAMAGVPYHALEKYLARLMQKGHRVAICDQLEDPKQAKGLVKRGVTRVLSPGTRLEDALLGDSGSSFLAAICVRDGKAGLAYLEPSTGEFLATELEGEIEERLLQELARIRPSELLLGPEAEAYGSVSREGFGSAITEFAPLRSDRAEERLRRQFQVGHLGGFGLENQTCAVVAAGMILAYAEQNQLPLQHVDAIASYSVDGFMRLDPATRRSLELTQNLQDGKTKYTLLESLDETRTAMGARLLRAWIDQPLLDAKEIGLRLQGVERMVDDGIARSDLREALGRLADVMRLVSRLSSRLATPRDVAALRSSLLVLPDLAEPLRRLAVGRIQELRSRLGDHRDLALLLDRAVVPDPPAHLREGGVFREGYDPELDALKQLSRSGKDFIAQLETKEREETGISNLKAGFNNVFGYYLEVPKAQIGKVPDHYIRKQTTAGAERYITTELKEHEAQVLSAVDKAVALETELFERLRYRISEHTSALMRTAHALAELDVLASLAEIATYRKYCRPVVCEEDVLEIEGGRHPVVERASPHFVPNDTSLGASRRMMVLTGPNMSGKSTYLRQNALMVLMAQIGSFVPASQFRLGICDRIFARIGAKDELALGQSTFMVEMLESANILNHAGPRSLVVLDEVGRGTSTYDGLAIAWAMIEHLAEVGCKTLFATHYHQLNALESALATVHNYRIAVQEDGDEIVWTHRVLPGGTDRSYGIHVARMAGVPAKVLARARDVLRDLEATDAPTPATTKKLQLTLFEMDEPEIVRSLKGLDVNQLSPLEALTLLDRWKRDWG